MLYRPLVALLTITPDYLPAWTKPSQYISTFVCRAKCDQGPYTGRIRRLDSPNPPGQYPSHPNFPGLCWFCVAETLMALRSLSAEVPVLVMQGELPFRFGPPRRRGRVNHVQRSDCMLILHFNREKVLEDFPAMTRRLTPLSYLIWDILKDQAIISTTSQKPLHNTFVTKDH